MRATRWRWPFAMRRIKGGRKKRGRTRGAGEFTMKWLFAVVLGCVMFCCVGVAADAPKLIYSKSFPGSKPEYMAVILERNGDAEYREAVDDDSPIKFHLSDSEAAEIFSLADQLDHFKR